jgi:hypothetical protein
METPSPHGPLRATLLSFTVLAFSLTQAGVMAEQIPVMQKQGAMHGFLLLKD